VPADGPTILATSGGFRAGAGGRRRFDFAPLVHHAVELSGAHGRAPRVLSLLTASGDQRSDAAELDEAARAAGFALQHLHLFAMPNHEDVEALVLAQDVVWVGGGSVANLLAVWRVHGLDAVFRRAWEAGVVLSGVSAGSICWHVGGTTDSFGPTLRPVTNALALLPWGNGVHYDSEAQRRPLVQRLVAEGVLPRTYCTDDGAGLVYRGTDLVEAVAERPNAMGYQVERVPSSDTPGGFTAVETPLPTRRLPPLP
jgi:peptidase E